MRDYYGAFPPIPLTLSECRLRSQNCKVADSTARIPEQTSRGSVPERPKGAGCKPAGSAYGGSNPPRPTRIVRPPSTSTHNLPVAGSPKSSRSHHLVNPWLNPGDCGVVLAHRFCYRAFIVALFAGIGGLGGCTAGPVKRQATPLESLRMWLIMGRHAVRWRALSSAATASPARDSLRVPCAVPAAALARVQRKRPLTAVAGHTECAALVIAVGDRKQKIAQLVAAKRCAGASTC